jgi:hypothetical protein
MKLPHLLNKFLMLAAMMIAMMIGFQVTKMLLFNIKMVG